MKVFFFLIPAIIALGTSAFADTEVPSKLADCEPVHVSGNWMFACAADDIQTSMPWEAHSYQLFQGCLPSEYSCQTDADCCSGSCHRRRIYGRCE